MQPSRRRRGWGGGTNGRWGRTLHRRWPWGARRWRRSGGIGARGCRWEGTGPARTHLSCFACGDTKRVGRPILVEGRLAVTCAQGLPRVASPVVVYPRPPCVLRGLGTSILCVTQTRDVPRLCVPTHVSPPRPARSVPNAVVQQARWGEHCVLLAGHGDLVDRMVVGCPPSHATSRSLVLAHGTTDPDAGA